MVSAIVTEGAYRIRPFAVIPNRVNAIRPYVKIIMGRNDDHGLIFKVDPSTVPAYSHPKIENHLIIIVEYSPIKPFAPGP